MADLITGFNAISMEDKKKDESEASQFLSFYLSGKLYALGILEVEEIIEPSEITEMPLAPEHIRGVINLRGKVVPVFDLTVHMGHGRQSIGKRSCIILVQAKEIELKGQTLGLLVDSVNEIVEIAESNILPPPRLGDGINTKIIQAMGRVEDTFIILLRIKSLLSEDLVNELSALPGIDDLSDFDEELARIKDESAGESKHV